MALPPLKIKISADTKGVQASLDQVEAAVDGVDEATRKYNSTLANLARASKSGAISADQLAAATDEAERNYRSAASSAAALTGAQVTASRQAKVLGGAMQGSSAHTANLGAQFNDIGVMLAAGQSPLMLAVQQGTQINQVMAQMGGGKTALRGLAAGFMSMVNPMSLATIGIIAGGAALIQWGMSASEASEESKKLAERMEEIEESADNAARALERARLGITSEEQRINEALVQQQRDLDNMALRRMGSISLISEIEAEIANLQSQSIQESSMLMQGKRAQLAAAKAALENDEMALAAIGDQMKVLRDNLALERERVSKVRLYNEGLTDATIKSMELAGIDISGEISRAAIEAAKLAQNLGLSVEQAQAVMRIQAALRSGSGIPEGEFGGTITTPEDVRFQGTIIDGSDVEDDGGGGGGRRTNSGLTSLVDMLQTEREQLAEWYAESQELLQNASDAELAILGGKHEAMQRLEAEHQERMRAITDSGMSSAVQTYEKYGSQILSGLGATSQQIALINAAVGASQALADPSIPFFGKFAAVAQVLAAGRSLAKQAEAGGRGAASPSGGVSAAPAVVSREVNVNLTGGDARSQGNIRDLIEQINEAVGDGASLNVRMA